MWLVSGSSLGPERDSLCLEEEDWVHLNKASPVPTDLATLSVSGSLPFSTLLAAGSWNIVWPFFFLPLCLFLGSFIHPFLYLFIHVFRCDNWTCLNSSPLATDYFSSFSPQQKDEANNYDVTSCCFESKLWASITVCGLAALWMSGNDFDISSSRDKNWLMSHIAA